MPLIGYARVSTKDHTPLPQTQALKSAGCTEVHEEQASGGDRARPVLARVLERTRKGDTLVVARIDRLARSLSHLLEVIDRLEAKGAFVRSIQDPIDTASPQGKFTLQVLGAAAEFERALIRECTRAGLASARAAGRVGGNPGLRARDPVAIRKVQLARLGGYMDRLNDHAADWVPHVRPLPPDRRWTQARLLRAYVRDGFLPDTVWGAPSSRLSGGRSGHHAAGDLRPAGAARLNACPHPAPCGHDLPPERRAMFRARNIVGRGARLPGRCAFRDQSGDARFAQ